MFLYVTSNVAVHMFHLDADDTEAGHVGDHVLLAHLVPVGLPGVGIKLDLATHDSVIIIDQY